MGRGPRVPVTVAVTFVVTCGIVWAVWCSQVRLGFELKCRECPLVHVGLRTMYIVVRPCASRAYWLIVVSGRHPRVRSPFGLQSVASCVLFDFGMAVINGCHPWLSSRCPSLVPSFIKQLVKAKKGRGP